MTVRFLKPRLYGTGKDVVARAYAQIEDGIEAVMTILNIGRTRAHALADPQEAREQLAYTEARQLTKAGATVFAEDLALLAGGMFLPMTIDTANCVGKLSAGTARAAGETMAKAIDALSDGKITDPEFAALQSSVDDLLRIALSLRVEIDRQRTTAQAAE